MTYSLRTFTTNAGQRRLYVNGTTRTAVYLVEASNGSGELRWSSRENDTPPKFRKGDHWGKVNKNRDAAEAVCAAFGLELGKVGEFERAWDIAVAGIEKEA
jgi:hypothetical protein